MTKWNPWAIIEELQDLLDYRVNVLSKTDYYFQEATTGGTITSDASGSTAVCVISIESDDQPKFDMDAAATTKQAFELGFLVGTLFPKYADANNDDVVAST